MTHSSKGRESAETVVTISERFGVRARLLLAFFGIAAFTLIAALAGLYAFREVGARIGLIESSIPATLAAADIARSSERIIASAPKLLSATEPHQRTETKALLMRDINLLREGLHALEQPNPQSSNQERIGQLTNELVKVLADLESLVNERATVGHNLHDLIERILGTNVEIQRLLSPWLEVVESQIDQITRPSSIATADTPASVEQLIPLLRLQRLIRDILADLASITTLVTQSGNSDQTQQLKIIGFQINLALNSLYEHAIGLTDDLKRLYIEQLDRLSGLVSGETSVTLLRNNELNMLDKGKTLLDRIEILSMQLTEAVDLVAAESKRATSNAIDDTLAVHQFSIQLLITIALLSFVTSILIVWLYVGRNIIGRLTQLRDNMQAIAQGELDTPIHVRGRDEISTMAQALASFRQSIRERDGLQHASEFKSRFLASASHDLRQPLHALTLFAEQLRAESNPEAQARLASRICESVESINALFDELLDMTKLDAGLVQVKPCDFPLQSLLSNLDLMFRQTAAQRQLSLRIIPSDCWVHSDPLILERVLLNLLSNALRYTNEGGVLLGCRRSNGKLRIDVYDTGPGISNTEQKHIFDEYVQLDDAPVARRQEGFGLGLAIVDRLSKLLQHPLQISSRVGRGSRFSLTLPLVAAPTKQTQSAIQPLLPNNPIQGKNILLVDDDPLILEGMSGLLSGWGARVQAALNAEQAINLAVQTHPDIIISDFQLSATQTGDRLIKLLREKLRKETPALLITGDTSKSVAAVAAEQKLDMLNKPLSPMRLRAVLNHLLSETQNP